jgi:ADP-ribose pyrophosphatase YjhB (NUDIX family)
MGKIPTRTQVSSGGDTFQEQAGRTEIALIADDRCWQLPNGMVYPDESTEEAARRDVREETGLEPERIGRIDKIALLTFESETEVARKTKEMIRSG